MSGRTSWRGALLPVLAVASVMAGVGLSLASTVTRTDGMRTVRAAGTRGGGIAPSAEPTPSPSGHRGHGGADDLTTSPACLRAAEEGRRAVGSETGLARALAVVRQNCAGGSGSSSVVSTLDALRSELGSGTGSHGVGPDRSGPGSQGNAGGPHGNAGAAANGHAGESVGSNGSSDGNAGSGGSAGGGNAGGSSGSGSHAGGGSGNHATNHGPPARSDPPPPSSRGGNADASTSNADGSTGPGR